MSTLVLDQFLVGQALQFDQFNEPFGLVEVTGSGSFAGLTLTVNQSASGQSLGIITGTGTFSKLLQATQIAVAQVAEEIFSTGGGVEIFAPDLIVSQSATGELILPLEVTGSGIFTLDLVTSQTAVGLIEEALQGSGLFSLDLVVSQSAVGLIEEAISGEGIFSLDLAVTQTGSGILISPVEGQGTYTLDLLVSQSATGGVNLEITGVQSKLYRASKFRGLI